MEGPALAGPGGLKPAPPTGLQCAPSLFHAGGCEAEVEEVFRRVLSSGVSLDQVEIVCASPAYPSLVWEKAVRYDWPVTIGQGIAVTQTRPGRALLAFTEWIEDDFAAGRLRRMFESGDVRLDEDGRLKSGRAARLLVQAQAAWGRDTYRLAFGRLAKSSRRAAERDDLPPDTREGLVRRAEDAEWLGTWTDTLVRSVPAPEASGLVDLQDVASSARAFVSDHSARASALDHVAATALADAIVELQALGGFRCQLEEALRFLRERVESLTVAADRPRPGHLFVSALTTAGVFGPAARVRRRPRRGTGLPVASRGCGAARRRARCGQHGSAAVRRQDRGGRVRVARRLAAITADPNARVTMSYSCRDLREYRQTFASWVLLQAYRVVSGRAGAAFRDLHQHLGEPSSVVPAKPEHALDESRWWLEGVTRAGPASRPAILARYPFLQSGITAHDARASDTFTEYDGHVPAAGASLDPGRPGQLMSATQLEEAADCPFRHFLKRGLRVYAIESGERDRDVWISHMLRGSLLHDLYARLLRRCRTATRRASVKEDGDWLVSEGARMLTDLAIEMPPPSVEVRERETSAFLEDLKLFVQAEEKLAHGRTPVGFEVSFGRADSVDEEPLAHADPVEIKAGGLTLRIAGRIDRIDRVGPSQYEIVDYKTGRYYAPAWQGTFAGGTRLQHALYGLAAAELLRRKLDPKAQVVAAEYYFPSNKGTQQRKRIATPALATTAQVLADLREVIRSGLFVHAAKEDACKFCDHGLACGRDVKERAEAKLADAAARAFREVGRA